MIEVEKEEIITHLLAYHAQSEHQIMSRVCCIPSIEIGFSESAFPIVCQSLAFDPPTIYFPNLIPFLSVDDY
jgi:hypothetical protein